MSKRLPLVYEGSVKNVLGPEVTSKGETYFFNYTDDFSVFDWGKMPDELSQKGQALAILAAYFFENLETPHSWKEFSKSHEALQLRRGCRFGAKFNELGEILKDQGLRTHYLGIPSKEDFLTLKTLNEHQEPFSYLGVKPIQVFRPNTQAIFDQWIMDYSQALKQGINQRAGYRLIPVEAVFRFSLPPGSSLPKRLQTDPLYLRRRGFDEAKLKESQFEFPVLELFTKLEPADRPLEFSEALAISGVQASLLEELLFKTAWVSGWLRSVFNKIGLTLADGKLEWALDVEKNELVLVDAIGPDELRLLKGKVQVSKELLRQFYRKTSWYKAIEEAKDQAQERGLTEWKKLVTVSPPLLPKKLKNQICALYPALTNEITEKKWFQDVPHFKSLIESLEKELP